MSLPSPAPEGAQDFLLNLTEQAGAIALDFFRTGLGATNKASGGAYDPVTEADREIERVLRAEIGSAYPDHGIVGEEFENTDSRSPFTWYLDPIDGTRAFVSGSPLWGTLIGLTVEGQPTLGAMVQPYIGETFWGNGSESFLDVRGDRVPLRSASTEQLDDAVLYSTHPDILGSDDMRQRFQRLMAVVKMTRFGGDCYSYGMLAAGFIDLVVENGLKPFDIVPLVPILQGAGCAVTGWFGEDVAKGGSVLASATPVLHKAASACLATT